MGSGKKMPRMRCGAKSTKGKSDEKESETSTFAGAMNNL